MTCFIARLKEHIRTKVISNKPKDVWEVVRYAKLCEGTNKFMA